MTSKWDKQYSEKADKFASTEHWQKEAMMVQRLELGGRKGVLAPKLTPLTVLDLGCNTGAFLDVLFRSGVTGHINYIGIDPNQEALRALTIRRDNIPLLSKVVDTSMENQPSESVDIVVCLHAINQMEDWDKELEHVYRVLKPKGKLVITTHNVWWGKARRLQTLLSSYTSDSTMVREPTKTQVVRKLKQDIGFKVKFARYFDSVEDRHQDLIASLVGNRLIVLAEK